MSKTLAWYLNWAIEKYGEDSKVVHEINKRISFFGNFEVNDCEHMLLIADIERIASNAPLNFKTKSLSEFKKNVIEKFGEKSPGVLYFDKLVKSYGEEARIPENFESHAYETITNYNIEFEKRKISLQQAQEECDSYEKKFKQMLDDDFNTVGALKVLEEISSKIKKEK